MTLGNPWTVIGYRADGRPIHLIAGGSGEDDDDDMGIDVSADDADEPDEDADEPAEEPEDKPKPKPPVAKGMTEADRTRLQGALDKERAAAKAARTRTRELEAELRAAKKAAEPKGDDDEVVVRAVEAARAEEQGRYKPLIVNKEARLALVAAGLSPDTSNARMTKLLKMIDLSDIDVDEDGEVSGLDDQIDQIKETLPELFRKAEPETPPAPKVRAPKLDAANKPAAQPAPRTTGEIHAAQILGTAR